MAVKNNIPKRPSPPQHRGLFWIFIISLFFCELLAYTWVRTESRHTLLEVSKAQDMLAQSLAYKKALLLERDRLKSDDRITRIAKTRLNLKRDTLIQTIYLAGDGK